MKMSITRAGTMKHGDKREFFFSRVLKLDNIVISLGHSFIRSIYALIKVAVKSKNSKLGGIICVIPYFLFFSFSFFARAIRIAAIHSPCLMSDILSFYAPLQ